MWDVQQDVDSLQLQCLDLRLDFLVCRCVCVCVPLTPVSFRPCAWCWWSRPKHDATPGDLLCCLCLALIDCVTGTRGSS